MNRREELAELLASVGGPRSGNPRELDSLALLQVVTWLEERYGIRLADHRIEPDDLRTVDGLLSVIERLA
jgi:acyl carrier protein